MDELADLIAQQNILLTQLINLLKPKELGFGESPRPQYIYCNRTKGAGLWYTLSDPDRQPVPIPEIALTGYIRKLEFKEVERRGEKTWKMHLHVMAHRLLVLEAGYDSVFCHCVLKALETMTVEQLRQPATLEVYANQSEEALFCRIYSDTSPIFAPWDRDTNWRSVARQAIANVEAANP